MIKLIKKVKQWRDNRFRNRIDRVYFQRDCKGNILLKGRLNIIPDDKTGVADVIVSTRVSQEEDLGIHSRPS